MSDSGNLWAAELEVAKSAGRAAGAAVMEFYVQQSAEQYIKKDGSVVTDADLAADRIIRAAILDAFPNDALLTEEGADDEARLSNSRVWIVDPIDGTRAFMQGSPDWAVCVALLDAGEPVLGIVHAPACDATYTALRGRGANRNGDAIRTSPAGALTGARIAGPKPMLDDLARAERFEAVPKIPSLALRLTRIADGSIDAGLISPNARDWDLAAADLVLSEAGGQLSDVAGRSVTYNRDVPVHGALMASNGVLAAPLRQALERLRDGETQPA